MAEEVVAEEVEAEEEEEVVVEVEVEVEEEVEEVEEAEEGHNRHLHLSLFGKHLLHSKHIRVLDNSNYRHRWLTHNIHHRWSHCRWYLLLDHWFRIRPDLHCGKYIPSLVRPQGH